MKLLNYLSILLLSISVVACSDEPGDSGAIKLKDTPKEITFYADGQSENDIQSITFTATGNWGAIATDELPTYSRGPIDWIHISPTSGGAGTFTIYVELDANTTGNDRTAYIMINCEGTDLAIKITQKATNANGDIPTAGRKNMRPVERICYEEETPSVYEGTYAIDFKYDTEGRISEMWCYTKSWGETERTILKVDYSFADELRISNTEFGTWNIDLDKQGRATSAYCYESKEQYTFTYNSQGRLSEVNFVDAGDDYSETYNMKIAYTDNLMTGFQQSEDGDIYFKEDYSVNDLYPGGLMNYASNYDFNAFMLFDMWQFSEEIIVPLYYMRYLGNTEDCLYMQVILRDDEEDPMVTPKAYSQPNTTYEERSISYNYGATTLAEYLFNGDSPTSISWNLPYSTVITTWTVTTGDQLIDPNNPHMGYQYTRSNEKTQTTEYEGLHKYQISYK